MSKPKNKISEFLEALQMERYKRILIKQDTLTPGEAKEIFNRTLDLFSKGEYRADPELKQFLTGRIRDTNGLEDLIAELKRRGAVKERLRKKFLKEQESGGRRKA